MAKVPTYDNFQVALQPGPNPQPSGPMPGEIAGQQAQRMGAAMSQAGGDLARIQLDAIEQANQLRVADAMNKAMAARLKWTHDKEAGYTTLRGQAALERPEGRALDQEYSDKLQADIGSIAASLGNDAQRRAFGMQADQMVAQFRGQVQAHLVQEHKQFAVSTQDGTIATGQNLAALEPLNPDSVAQGVGAIKAATAEKGRILGWSPAETVARMVDALSPAHAAVMSAAVQAGQIDYATAYLEKVKAELTPAARLQLQQQLKAGDQALQASRKADEIWAAAGPGQDRNAPVDLFAMERAAREAFAGDPAKAKATIQELRERAQAFNATQSEFHAANTTAVFRMLDSGAGMNKVRASAAWQALPGAEQHRITLSLEQEAAAREARAAAAEGRELTRLQRQQSMMLLNNGAAYLRYGDPSVLAGMSRQQVEALRSNFGMEGTQHLLQKWDALQKPAGKLEARIDREAFNHVADEFGLKPYSERKSEDEKRQLGELQFRVEQLINRAQAVKKGLLDPEEKLELMRQEMRRTVTVPTWGGISSDAVPVIRLTRDQAAKVQIPGADRAQIVDALRRMAATDPTNPRYSPTEDNVRRLYLETVSPAADLIPAPK